MSPSRIAVYVASVLVAVFGVVFVADALVESDQERLEELEARIDGARAATRVDLIADLASEEPVAVVADRRRVWVDAEQGEGALREAIDAAVPELGAGWDVVASDATITGERARVTLRLREGHETPVDLVVELAMAEHDFSLLEVRRMR